MNWNDIKDHIDLHSVEQALGFDVVIDGDEHVTHCPLDSHPGVDNNPSFSINATKLVYHCFSCGGGGTLVDLVRDVMGLDREEALQWLRAYTKGAFFRNDPDAFVTEVKRLLRFTAQPIEDEFPLYSMRILDNWCDNALRGEGARFYLDRGITLDSVDTLLLGYDPHHSKHYKYFGEVKLHVGPAAIIPIFFENNLIGYQERWIDRPEGIAKYTNTSKLPKRHIVFNYDIAILNREAPVVVVESPMTAAYLLHQTACTPVATFGGDVTPEQINLLRSFKTVYLAFDNDGTGQMAVGKVGRALMRTTDTRIVPPVDVEKGDLNDVNLATALEHIDAAIPAALHFAQIQLGNR